MTELADFLTGPVEEVAPRLLGCVIECGDVAVRLTEVEAYGGPGDPGSHAYRGRTPRNTVMFGPPGRLYCYFTYGMHVCANVVVGETGTPSAVLLRAGEVVRGLPQARERRPGAVDRDLARGPARLCNALGITLDDNDCDLTDGPVRLRLGDATGTVLSGPRVGLRGAPDRGWRFWLEGERTVSAYRPAKGLGPRFGAPQPDV